jgi:hypothetical protein
VRLLKYCWLEMTSRSMNWAKSCNWNAILLSYTRNFYSNFNLLRIKNFVEMCMHSVGIFANLLIHYALLSIFIIFQIIIFFCLKIHFLTRDLCSQARSHRTSFMITASLCQSTCKASMTHYSIGPCHFDNYF